MQTTLSIGALAFVMLFSLVMYRVTTETEQRMVLNEVATQMTGVGVEVLDYVGSKLFDAAADTSGGKGPLPIKGTGDLTPLAAFGNPDCGYATCRYIEEFAGKDTTMMRAGMRFDVAIEVHYVDPLNPGSVSVGATFAKEVSVRIAYAGIRMGGEPLAIEMARVFTYQKSTNV